MNMQTALKNVDAALAAWGPDPTEAECEAALAKYKANPSACTLPPEEIAASDAINDRLMAAEEAASAAAVVTPCTSVEDVLRVIDFVVRDELAVGDDGLNEIASGLLSRCADFLRGEVSRGAAN